MLALKINIKIRFKISQTILMSHSSWFIKQNFHQTKS